MRIPVRESFVVFLVVVIACLVSIIFSIIFDGSRPAKLLIKGNDGEIIEVDEE